MNTASIGKVCVLLFVAASAVKLMLVPAYHSTDFEVHRNWMAVTHWLPLEQWYFCETSIWSLDYPPLFAYFEYLLSHIAYFIDPSIIELSRTPISNSSTIYFQRISVIATDMVLAFAVYRCVSSYNFWKSRGNNASSINGKDATSQASASKMIAVVILVLFNGGLLLVDHIHFQYNGMMLGLLVLCVDCAFREEYILLALFFSVLVLLKHLFIPLAPLVGIYLTVKYCVVIRISSEGIRQDSFSIFQFFQLVLIAIFALVVAFGPFLLAANEKQYVQINNVLTTVNGTKTLTVLTNLVQSSSLSKFADSVKQLERILQQLFPLGRGLVHAYWAPNCWALYCVADKVIAKILKVSTGSANNVLLSSTSGLIGEFRFEVLPIVTAHTCLLLMFCAQLPVLINVYKDPNPVKFIRATVFVSMCSFMLGYHVHEKAIIIPMLLQSLLIFESYHDCLLFLQLSIVGIFGLMPLFNDLQELPIKWLIYLSYISTSFYFAVVHGGYRIATLWYPALQTIFLLVAGIFCEIVHPLMFKDPASGALNFPFLPCLLTSVLAASFLVPAWLHSLYLTLFS